MNGAGGFIGGHLVKRLATLADVTAVDSKPFDEWWQRKGAVMDVVRNVAHDIGAHYHDVNIVYHLAADMGGMLWIGDPKHDREVMLGNTAIDLHVMAAAENGGARRFIYASSACVYNETRQAMLSAMPLREDDAWPAQPDTAYGLEKLYAEKVLDALASPTFSPLAVRLHNVYGPHGSWTGGREKAPAALCRKIAEAKLNGTHEIEIIGDGEAIRSYLYVDDCVDGLIKFARTDRNEPINLGSDRAISVNDLAGIIEKIAGWPCIHRHVAGPQGVRARNADISELKRELNWSPPTSLEDGLAKTYEWIETQVKAAR